MIGQGTRVTDAAAALGPSASSVYRLYRRDAAFRAAWRTAQDDIFAASRPAVERMDFSGISDRALIGRLERPRF